MASKMKARSFRHNNEIMSEVNSARDNLLVSNFDVDSRNFTYHRVSQTLVQDDLN